MINGITEISLAKSTQNRSSSSTRYLSESTVFFPSSNKHLKYNNLFEKYLILEVTEISRDFVLNINHKCDHIFSFVSLSNFITFVEYFFNFFF